MILSTFYNGNWKSAVHEGHEGFIVSAVGPLKVLQGYAVRRV